MRNPPQIIAFSVALLLGLGSAGHAETLIQKALDASTSKRWTDFINWLKQEGVRHSTS